MTKMLSTKAFEKWLKAQAEIIKRYRQVEKSDILAEYNSLKAKVESSDFQENKLNTRKTLLGKLRWLSTSEHQQEKRLQALTRNLNIQLFESYTEEMIANLESYKLVWADEFDGSEMSKAWETGFLYPKGLKSNHSHTSECQAYMQGQNTSVNGSKLRISTKKENVNAAAWHPTKGMIMHPFAYTSDIWHTVEAMTPKTGVLQAKVRCSGKAKHLLCLTTVNASKVVSIMGTQPTTGEMIYTLVWNEKELVNYVNNVEVSRGKNPLAGEALHLLVRSYLPDAQKAGTAQLDIDWIRIYTNA